MVQSQKTKKGYLWIKGYTRSDGVKVKGHWTPDKGRKGRGKKLFTLKKGELTAYGYSLKNSSAKKRQSALMKASRHEGLLPVYRKVNALTILQRPNPTYEKRALQDKKFLKKKYAEKKKKEN